MEGSSSLPSAPCLLQAGAVDPLVRVLREHPDEIGAELAAAVLRNLCVKNPANRQAVLAVGGLQPLLRTLSSRQEGLVCPVACEVSLCSCPCAPFISTVKHVQDVT